MWASIWFTVTSGTLSVIASVFAAVRPTSSEPTSPGSVVTATAARSDVVVDDSCSAARITGRMRPTWARDAISGTTPPKSWWSSCCEATMLDSTLPSSEITAAAVSSHDDSMASSRLPVTGGSTELCDELVRENSSAAARNRRHGGGGFKTGFRASCQPAPRVMVSQGSTETTPEGSPGR